MITILWNSWIYCVILRVVHNSVNNREAVVSAFSSRRYRCLTIYEIMRRILRRSFRFFHFLGEVQSDDEILSFRSSTATSRSSNQEALFVSYGLPHLKASVLRQYSDISELFIRPQSLWRRSQHVVPEYTLVVDFPALIWWTCISEISIKLTFSLKFYPI